MKKYRFVLALLFVSFLFVLLPATAKAALWEVPTGLNPGDTFRWVFVTSQVTTATNPDIDYYNNLINNWMVSYPSTPISGVLGKDYLGEIEWKVIGSTPFIDAIVNIEGNSTDPVFDPLGHMIDDAVYNMFDGDILYPIKVDEYGTQTPYRHIWTGTRGDGKRDEYGYFASEEVRVGGIYAFRPEWWLQSDLKMDPSKYLPLYAISETLTQVPVPGALILAATGMLSATVGLKRLRRRHQE